MVTLIEFNLKSGDGERLLFISPVLLQSKKAPSLHPPVKAYIYDNLIKEDFWAHLGENKVIPKAAEKNELVIKHDQDFEKAYLGYITYSAENSRWECQDNSLNLDDDNIEKLLTFLKNYKNGKR